MKRSLPSAIGLLLAAAVALTAVQAAGQTPPERAYSLDQVVAEALAHHPRLRATRAEESAADARVDETSTGELPHAGVSAQLNRSTGNTPPGAFYPTPGFPPISGAPRGRTLDEGSWQTGVSLWATWDVLSVARQAAALDVVLAARSEATATMDARRLEVAYRAADAFLLLLEAQEAVRAAKASVDRASVLVTMTKPLVDQSLRPGVDVARAEAELASAQTVLARAEQASEVRRAQLGEAMGDASVRVLPSAGPLLGPVDDAPVRTTAPPTSHPDLLVSRAAAERASQVQKAVDVEYLPRLDLFGVIWLRGSGIYDSPAAGLVPDIPNWAAGAMLTWSALDIPAIRARARIGLGNLRDSGREARRDLPRLGRPARQRERDGYGCVEGRKTGAAGPRGRASRERASRRTLQGRALAVGRCCRRAARSRADRPGRCPFGARSPPRPATPRPGRRRPRTLPCAGARVGLADGRLDHVARSLRPAPASDDLRPRRRDSSRERVSPSGAHPRTFFRVSASPSSTSCSPSVACPRRRWRASSSATTSTTSFTSTASSTSSRSPSRGWRCSSCTFTPGRTSRSR